VTYAGDEEPDHFSQREASCIGLRDKECIAELKEECKLLGGKWLGEVIGRGRQWGCERPTKDGGKSCTDSSQCESTCLANAPSGPTQAASASACHCAATTLLPKGRPIFVCGKEGIKVIHID
jgi:hypothetical protein